LPDVRYTRNFPLLRELTRRIDAGVLTAYINSRIPA